MKRVSKQYIHNGMLFAAVFLAVLGLFIIWHQIFPQSQTALEKITAPTPLLRVGVAHQFLANLIQEIGGSYVATVVLNSPSQNDESPLQVCGKSSVFFGLNASLDGWIQEICGSRDPTPIKVFLDSYIGVSIDQDSAQNPSTQAPVIITGADKGYYWLSTQGGKDLARAIAKILSEADPVHKVEYLNNAYAVAYQLDEIYGSVKDPMSNLRVAPVIAWGDGWQEIIAEYNGKIAQTIDPIQSAQEKIVSIASIADYLKKHRRAIVVGDLSLPFDDIKKLYPDSVRRMVVLDPTGDFSDIWPYRVYVQQNLLRITKAL